MTLICKHDLVFLALIILLMTDCLHIAIFSKLHNIIVSIKALRSRELMTACFELILFSRKHSIGENIFGSLAVIRNGFKIACLLYTIFSR